MEADSVPENLKKEWERLKKSSIEQDNATKEIEDRIEQAGWALQTCLPCDRALNAVDQEVHHLMWQPSGESAAGCRFKGG